MEQLASDQPAGSARAKAMKLQDKTSPQLGQKWLLEGPSR